jgi:DNA-directed RNA polymerase I, II, and III subunit RPABC2
LNDEKKNNMDNKVESEENKDIDENKIAVSDIKTKTTKTKPKTKKNKKVTSTENDLNSQKGDENNLNPDASVDAISTRPEKFVEYEEREFELTEVIPKDKEILIGPKRLTRFEKARITGARALQLSFGAPLMINLNDNISRSSISLALMELESKALPISIRRILPNGLYQDIPIDWMKS